MSRLLRVDVRRRRLFVCGRRVHHGLVGLLVCLHDARDWRRWLADLAATEAPKPPARAQITYYRGR